ncbi:MAG TPA: hypothetical protein VNR86_02395 [Sphingomicrobium sp.]|nr:hypothetical protein [Sphingomicrobium sp.]
MRRVLFILLLAGCSKGPEADLQYIGQARSSAAEWALVNERASLGQLTHPYVDSMRRSLRSQIKSARSALTMPGSRYDTEMEALLAQPDETSPQELRTHVERLKQIEDELESA